MSKKKAPYKSLRTFLISLIIIIIIAVLLPFFLKGPDKKALISPDKIKLPAIKLIKDKPEKDSNLTGSKRNVSRNKLKKIYKWTDKNGVLHFTDYPNPDGPSELIIASPDQPTKESSGSGSSKTDAKQDSKPKNDSSDLPLPVLISPDQVKKLKKDAEKINKELEKRYEDINRQLK